MTSGLLIFWEKFGACRCEFEQGLDRRGQRCKCQNSEQKNRGSMNALLGHVRKRSFRPDICQMIAIGLVLLGLLHTSIYALAMPPWGLLDEPQHYHYVQLVAEERRRPVMWQDKIPEPITNSIFAVKRYETLGATMPERDEMPNRLESDSYEGYQPPLYYATLALIYVLGPSDILEKLFALRMAGVILSASTLIIVWKSTRLLWPDQIWIAVVATLFVALHPERAASAARLNNDLMLEITFAAAFGLLALATTRGPSWRLALLLGLSLGLAVLSKVSALVVVPIVFMGWAGVAYIQRISWRAVFGQLSVLTGSVAVCLVPLAVANLILYNEPMGLRTFLEGTGPLVSGAWSDLVVTGVLDLFRNSWAILWDNVRVVSKPSAAFLHLALIAESGLIAVVIGRAWSRQDERMPPLIRNIVVTSCAAILIVSISTVAGYVRGLLPVVQGRFLLPALVPTAWLIGYGLWLIGAMWRGLMATVFLFLEATLSMSVLFFHSLPKFYAPRDVGFLGYWPQTAYLFGPTGLFWDKPEFVNPWTLSLTIVLFCICVLGVGILTIRQYGSPVHAGQLRTLAGLLKSFPLAPQMAQGEMDVRAGMGWTTRLSRVWQDPLLWISCILLVVYLGWVSIYPAEVFWSLDEGGKYIHLQSIIQSGNPGAPISYPGRDLDPELRFVALNYWSRAGEQIYSWWPVSFQLITWPFFKAWRWPGLYLLPAASGALSAMLAGIIVRHLHPQRRWLSAGAGLVTGLATPVAFYSTTFWEHTPSVACFLGGVIAILQAWKTGRPRWLVIAGIILALATYLRLEVAPMAVGIVLVLLILRWRWSLLLGSSYLLASIPWLVSNQFLMGHLLSRQWLPGDVSLSIPLFSGFRQAGIWYVPYTLFNSPNVVAFEFGTGLLALATLLTALTLVVPFVSRFRWLSVVTYGGLALICGWILFQPEGYRSVHGFVLIAPHIVFVAWLYRSPSNWRRSPLAIILIGMASTYAIAYLARGWVAAGGLQWGPRYLLAFYPLFVAASVGGLTTAWPSLKSITKYVISVLYVVSVLIGFGYQVRGVYASLETRRYYKHTEQAIQQLSSETIVTGCPWLAMVMPNLYWTGSVFVLGAGATFDDWVPAARSAGVHSVCQVDMDMCQLIPLDEVATYRAVNPGGIETQCFAE
jgi:4-amino-4-deoxy-L-arabinose transferase-like glycosyltransferase